VFKNSLLKALAFTLSLLLASNTVAAIHVLLPVEARIASGDEIDIGSVAAGETFSVVVNKKSGSGFDWEHVSVQAPADWKTEQSVTDKTLVSEITVPRNASESIQIISFSLSSSQAQENFKTTLTVKKNLLTVAMDNLKQETTVGKPIFYNFVVSNDSIAEHTLTLSSSLPNYWFAPIEVTVPAKQKKELVVELVPKAYGLRNFSFSAQSNKNAFSKDFAAELTVAPTIQGKFIAAAYAFPFFTLSNLPFYIFNAFLSMPFAQIP
jgi:hypothetical protein